MKNTKSLRIGHRLLGQNFGKIGSVEQKVEKVDGTGHFVHSKALEKKERKKNIGA